MTVDRRGVLVLVSTFLVSFLVLRGFLVELAGQDRGTRSPVLLDLGWSVLLALVACRFRRVIEGDDRGR